jgi:hypothetical protein
VEWNRQLAEALKLREELAARAGSSSIHLVNLTILILFCKCSIFILTHLQIPSLSFA